MKLLICFGTRPEYIKLKPLFQVLDKAYYDICFIEQHKDLVIEEEVRIRIFIGQGPNRLNTIVSSILIADIPWSDYSHVLVQGDTGSAFGSALSAFHHKRTVIHLEAGLRTYNKQHPWPEESYRSMISRLADIHLCPGPDSVQHLLDEQVEGVIHNVGNTVMDALFQTVREKQIVVVPSSESKLVLVTLHRRENWASLQDLFVQIEGLAQAYKETQFVFLKHPNPDLQRQVETAMPSVRLLDPQPYADCIRLIASCRCIITDSGGIQEEAAALGKRLLVLREATERTELLERYVVLWKNSLGEGFREVYTNPSVEPCIMYGQGETALLIKSLLRL
jgi:UDP-N-acetylglucosamine 2-epimerase (non-hydrolysing)